MTTITDRVDALFTQWDKPTTPGCILAVIRDGEFLYKRGYGMADLERGVPITSDSIFDIGSTGKQFTAAVIAILANQGHLILDAPIRKHLPEMPAYADGITIRHLIHHTSGLRDYLTLRWHYNTTSHPSHERAARLPDPVGTTRATRGEYIRRGLPT